MNSKTLQCRGGDLRFDDRFADGTEEVWNMFQNFEGGSEKISHKFNGNFQLYTNKLVFTVF